MPAMTFPPRRNGRRARDAVSCSGRTRRAGWCGCLVVAGSQNPIRFDGMARAASAASGSVLRLASGFLLSPGVGVDVDGVAVLSEAVDESDDAGGAWEN